MPEHTDRDDDTDVSQSADASPTGGIKRRTYLGSVLAALGSSALPSASGQETDGRDLNAIIAEMSLDDKISMLHQHPGGIIPALPDHDIPEIDMRDGPNGVRTMGPQSAATSFPANIVAASTFDPELIRKEGAAIAREVKADDANVLLAPATNINRVPVGGRTFEYYSEDPYLSSIFATEFTKGVQSEEVVATVKHYVANNQEHERDSINVDVGERALREIYYPPYKAAVQEGGAGAVMAALNKVNGEYCTENEEILQNVLKDEWGFEGYVISDFFGVHSTVDAALSGHDVELVHGAHFGDPLKEAVQEGIVSEDLIDEKVHRVLWALQTTGALDGVDDGAIGTDDHFDIAQQIAEEGSVLLKNEGDVLPLDEDEIDSLAVVGPDPDSFRIAGGGSSEVPAIREIGLVEGIGNVVDDVSIEPVSSDPFQPFGPDAVSPPDSDQNGLRAEYFDNPDLSGDPAATEVVDDVQVDDTSEASGISGDLSIRWTAKLTAPASGTYRFSLESVAPTTLSIDGEAVVINEGGQFESTTATGELELQADTTYDVRIELTGGGGDGVFLDWDRPDVNPLDEAARVAGEKDAAIALVRGSSTEGRDRDDMVLDGNQNEMVQEVASANENSIVLVNTGGPVEMPWISAVSSAMQVWYPGQEAGNAVANLLFGRTNPSGKLPMTLGKEMKDYPADEPAEYPGEEGTVHYNEGVFVGYRHFDEEDIEPLFPFGHGESYTTFEYSKLRVTPGALNPGTDSLTVEVTVENTGDRDGAEVVQVYLEDVEASVERPPKELAAFERVELEADERTTVELELGEEAFQFYDPDDGWTLEPGEFNVLVGSSSRDIRVRDTVRVAGRRNETGPGGSR